ncbi:MAG: hypothetical protein GKR77_01370 [Legionellales bacterium]|nr:hypothetical protein [Legionellales bacterium]
MILSKLVDPLLDGPQSAFDRITRLLSLSAASRKQEESVSEEQEESHPEPTLLRKLVTKTQREWIRRSQDRWNDEEKRASDVPSLDELTESTKESINSELKALGFIEAVPPPPVDNYRYQWGMVFGGSIPAMFKRLDYLWCLINEDVENRKIISGEFEIFLLGSRNSSSRYLNNLPGLVQCFPDKFNKLKNKGGGLPKQATEDEIKQWVSNLEREEGVFLEQATESEVMQWLADQMEWPPKGVTFTLIDTPFQPVVGSNQLRAPKSDDQLRCLLEELNTRDKPWPQGPVLAVTNNPFVQRQASLNTLTIFFSSLGNNILPVVVPVGCDADKYTAKIGEQIKTGNLVDMKGLLDECARYFYQLERYLIKQENEVERIKQGVEENDHTVQALLSEILGYIHLGCGEYQKARESYQKGLSHIESEERGDERVKQLSERLSNKIAEVNRILEKSQTVNRAGFFAESGLPHSDGRVKSGLPDVVHESVASMG